MQRVNRIFCFDCSITLGINLKFVSDGMKAGLGGGASGAFSNNFDVWKYLEDAATITGDRVWRFPLWSYYKRRVLDLDDADITNLGAGPGGGPCRAAAFLRVNLEHHFFMTI